MGKFWGGAALTPGGEEETASLRIELGGAIGVFLVLYVIQVQCSASTYFIKIGIDNADTLPRAGDMLERGECKTAFGFGI